MSAPMDSASEPATIAAIEFRWPDCRERSSALDRGAIPKERENRGREPHIGCAAHGDRRPGRDRSCRKHEFGRPIREIGRSQAGVVGRHDAKLRRGAALRAEPVAAAAPRPPPASRCPHRSRRSGTRTNWEGGSGRSGRRPPPRRGASSRRRPRAGTVPRTRRLRPSRKTTVARSVITPRTANLSSNGSPLGTRTGNSIGGENLDAGLGRPRMNTERIGESDERDGGAVAVDQNERHRDGNDDRAGPDRPPARAERDQAAEFVAVGEPPGRAHRRGLQAVRHAALSASGSSRNDTAEASASLRIGYLSFEFECHRERIGSEAPAPGKPCGTRRFHRGPVCRRVPAPGRAAEGGTPRRGTQRGRCSRATSPRKRNTPVATATSLRVRPRWARSSVSDSRLVGGRRIRAIIISAAMKHHIITAVRASAKATRRRTSRHEQQIDDGLVPQLDRRARLVQPDSLRFLQVVEHLVGGRERVEAAVREGGRGRRGRGC